jgi:large subunit ribosomal protein L21
MHIMHKSWKGGIMAYAVISVGGHQEKVEVGSIVVANRLQEKAGSTVTFPCKLFVDENQIVAAGKKLEEFTVSAKVISDSEKGKKIDIMKYKNKTRYHKRMGHRQELTRLEILSIGSLKKAVKSKAESKPVEKKPAAKKPAVKKSATAKASAPKPAAKKAAPAKKPVAKKAPAKKAAPAKKPAAKKAAPAKKPAAKKAPAKAASTKKSAKK